jgi:transcriptional regulator with XRE-family HTH domain
MICFWDRIRGILHALNKPDIWLIKNAGLGKTAIVNGQRKQTSPSVDIAYRCAKALEITIEEIIDGETGEQYIREYVRRKGWQFSPPERIADIVEAAEKLSDEQLDYVMGLITTMLEKQGDSGASPESKSGKKLPQTG